MFKHRVRDVLIAFLAGGALILARLGVIQVSGHYAFDHSRFTRVGGDHTVETCRGGIYMFRGRPLAVQAPSYDLGVHYGELAGDGWKEAAGRLSGLPADELTARAEQIQRRVESIRRAVCERHGRDDMHVREEYQYYSVADDLPVEAAAALRAEPDRFGGLRILVRSRRSYPDGFLAAHIVGQMRRIGPEEWLALREGGETWTAGMGVSRIGALYKMDDNISVSGIEKSCEELLRGRRGHVINRLSVGVLKVTTRSEETAPVRGADVYLTLRESFQRAANDALRRAAADPGLDFDGGAVVVLDVHSGAILAAATWPGYDLARYRQDYEQISARAGHPFVFRPLQAVLPPGSVFKIVTAIAALEGDKMTPETTRRCEGAQVFYGRRFHCTGHHGRVALLEAIERSCNVYFYNAGCAVGGDGLAEYAHRLGLGVPTGVDWPSAAVGNVPVPPPGRGVVNMSIGQGDMLCTPLQVANMMATVANGGRLYVPHFFDRAMDADGDLLESYRPQWRETGLRPETLQVVREGMRRVVEGRKGTARRAGLARFRAAGKTGTAETGQQGVFHAWFAGYAPHDRPKIAFVAVNERTSGHGSSHAAPIIADVLDRVWGEVERMP